MAARARLHAALADVTRLRIVDRLAEGDAAPSELAALVELPSNLMAFHLKVLVDAGLVSGHPSEGDRRRRYLRLVPGSLDALTLPTRPAPARVVFVCTANTARSQLAVTLWRRASRLAVTSAGTHPGDRVAPQAVAASARHGIPMRGTRPRHISDVVADTDLVITVCDAAHEELGARGDLHWSVPDPARRGTDAAFDAAFDDIAARVAGLAPLLQPTS